MCGIASIISTQAEDREYISTMTRLLVHRGPDDAGQFTSGPVALGHRRLSIIDLSPAGHQPMHNETYDLHLVCNGEIYNYKKLTEELIMKGHRFSSHCDSEVILHLYEEYGSDMLPRLNGMFAFALWDEKRQRLMLAIDRFGKKPLYWTHNKGRFAAASEMKAIIALPWIKKELDPVSVDRFLTFRHVPAPASILKNINKLEPAHFLLWHKGQHQIGCYWKLQNRGPIPYNQCTLDSFDDLFNDCVRIRLQSDVPIGFYLSGGVDSALVAATTCALHSTVKKSYTLSLNNEYDEGGRTKLLANYLGIESNFVSVTANDFNLLPRIAWHLDEPFGDLICLPAFLLAKKAKEQLTVVLTGDGADEILMGYLHDRIMTLQQRTEFLFRHRTVGKFFSALTRVTPPSLLNLFFDYPDKLSRVECNKLEQTLLQSDDFFRFYESFTACFTPYDKCTLYSHPMKSILKDFRSINDEIRETSQSVNEFPLFSKLAILDLKFWLPFSVIFRLDKLSMAHAVETRSPFLDYRMVELCLNLHPIARMGKTNKVILRDSLARRLPQSLCQHGKQAFYIPIVKSFQDRFLSWATSLLTEDSVRKRGLFEWCYIRSLLASDKPRSMLQNRQLAAIAMLEQWMKVYIDNPGFTP